MSGDRSRIEALAALQAAGGGLSCLQAAERAAGPVETWWWSDRGTVLPAAGLGPKRLAASLDGGADARVRSGIRKAEALGWRPLDPDEIPALRTLPEPPLLLWVKGSLGDAGAPALAVVGARRASAYGLRVARHLARETASRGVAVLSGLARGIDAMAHLGALDVGGRTVAVLGCGPDRVYPPEHAGLQARIGEEGALLTEHLPGTPPRAHHFPRRNRILVALSRAVLVVEARLRSGTLTSVRWAADLGRDVLVVPGPVDSQLSEGPLQLLREGCVAVGHVDHILEALGLEAGTAVAGAAAAPSGSRFPDAGPTPAESRFLALLSAGSLDLDDIVRLSGEPPGRVLTLLLSLELSGHVVRDGDGAGGWRALTRAAGG